MPVPLHLVGSLIGESPRQRKAAGSEPPVQSRSGPRPEDAQLREATDTTPRASNRQSPIASSGACARFIEATALREHFGASSHCLQSAATRLRACPIQGRKRHWLE